MEDLAHLECRRISSITHVEVQRLHSRLGTDIGHTTANRAIELLKAVINKGKKWGLFDGNNPCCGIEKYKLKPRQRFLESEELPRLLKAIDDEPDETIRDFIWILLSTGVRKTNVLEMRWDQLDLPNAIWTIPDTKNGTSQTILLTEKELEILNRRHSSKRDFRWVFAGKGACGHLVDPKKGWQRILTRAKIDDLHIHNLRRSLDSYMAMTGASLSVIGNVLNHKDVSTTRRVYAQSAREAERAARQIAHTRMFGPAAAEHSQNAAGPGKRRSWLIVLFCKSQGRLRCWLLPRPPLWERAFYCFYWAVETLLSQRNGSSGYADHHCCSSKSYAGLLCAKMPPHNLRPIPQV